MRYKIWFSGFAISLAALLSGCGEASQEGADTPTALASSEVSNNANAEPVAKNGPDGEANAQGQTPNAEATSISEPEQISGIKKQHSLHRMVKTRFWSTKKMEGYFTRCSVMGSK